MRCVTHAPSIALFTLAKKAPMVKNFNLGYCC